MPERCESHPQPSGRSGTLVHLDAVLGKGARLLVPVPHHFETDLIATHCGHDVVCLGERGDTLGLAPSDPGSGAG